MFGAEGLMGSGTGVLEAVHEGSAPGGAGIRRVVVYGEFSCPWSYLASRRAGLLAADGVEVDWRALDPEPLHVAPPDDAPLRLSRILTAMDTVLGALHPGEQLPYALAGFVPHTTAAVSGYAETHGAGAAPRVRQLLFEALWLHGCDLGDPSVVHTLVIDAVRSDSVGGPLSVWDYADVQGSGASGVTELPRRWAEEWRDLGAGALPLITVDQGEPMRGPDAVAWLGAQLVQRGLLAPSVRWSGDEATSA
jgi:hypothetical protein